MTTDSSAGALRPVTSRGQRLAAAVNLAAAIGGRGRWVAGRLSDGGTDGNVYDTRAEAVAHQITETQCAYVCVPEQGMPESEASAYLELAERIYDSGRRLSDPEATPMLTRAAMPGLRRLMNARNARERFTR